MSRSPSRNSMTPDPKDAPSPAKDLNLTDLTPGRQTPTPCLKVLGQVHQSSFFSVAISTGLDERPMEGREAPTWLGSKTSMLSFLSLE